jgi:dihydroflavonol-4-reductase
MKILVTGASGFVGSALCDELTQQGHDVFALMRATSSTAHLKQARFTSVLGDLRNQKSLQEAVKDAEVIIHGAGLVTARSRDEFFEHNALGTQRLVEAARDYAPGLKRFVYISSLAAAGPSDATRARDEADQNAPVSFYGQSKLAGEDFVRASGVPSVIIRPPAVYGPRDKGVFEFFKMTNMGIQLAIGGAAIKPYSFVHVDDLVQGILAAAFCDKTFAPGEVFYICGDDTATWESAMQAIAAVLGKSPLQIPAPLALVTAIGALYSGLTKISGKTFPMNLDKVKELKAPAWTCQNAKAKRMLGFKPFWDLNRGLEHTARWYKDQGWL